MSEEDPLDIKLSQIRRDLDFLHGFLTAVPVETSGHAIARVHNIRFLLNEIEDLDEEKE